MAGIDSNWQGAFVGAFIILAVLIGMETRGFSFTEMLRNMFRIGKDR
jgi:ribose transport system permease protein